MNMQKLKPGSHNSLILSHLAAGRTLTVMQAFRMFDCCSLSRRIVDLRRRHHRIKAEMRMLPSGKRCAVYSLA
jgi:hypothetical protein